MSTAEYGRRLRAASLIQYAEKLRRLRAEYESATDGLAELGREIVELLTETESLRSVARRSSLSATYLSRIRSGAQTISPGSFLLLCVVLEQDQAVASRAKRRKRRK